MPAEAMPGPASGNSTCQNACQRVQPSICAASARSLRHLPEEAVDQPDGEGHVERDIGEDQPEMRVDDAEPRIDEEQRQRQRDARHRARQHQAEEHRRLGAEAVAGEGVAAGHADDDGDHRRRHRDDQRIAEVVDHRNAALADAAEHRDVGVERDLLRNPHRWLGHDLDGWPERRQHDPDTGQADDQHRQEQADRVRHIPGAASGAVGGVLVHPHHSAPICVRAAASLR